MIRNALPVRNVRTNTRKTGVFQIGIILFFMFVAGVPGGAGLATADSVLDDSGLLDKLSLGITLNQAMEVISDGLSSKIINNSETQKGREIVFKASWLGYSDLSVLMVFSTSGFLEALYVVFPEREHRCLSMPDFTTDILKLKAVVEKKYNGYTSCLASPLWNPDNPQSFLSCHDLPSKGLKDLLLWSPADSLGGKIAIGGMAWDSESSNRSRFSVYLKITGPNEIRNIGSLAERLREDSLDLALGLNLPTR